MGGNDRHFIIELATYKFVLIFYAEVIAKTPNRLMTTPRLGGRSNMRISLYRADASLGSVQVG